MPLSPLFDRYEHVILDLDGTVWIGDRPTRRAPEAVGALRAAAKKLAFITNDARRSPEDYVRKLWSLGVQASLEEMVSVGAAIQFVLAERPGPVETFVIGSPAVFRHVADAGQRSVNGTEHEERAHLVVVAGHDELDYRALRTAARAVTAGAEMLAAGRDRTFPTDGGIAPGTGAIVAALEYATERTASIVGKPDPRIFRAALDRLGNGPTLVVGDRLDSDLAGATAAGLDGAVVLSGNTSADQARAAEAEHPAPVAIAEDLHELVLNS